VHDVVRPRSSELDAFVGAVQAAHALAVERPRDRHHLTVTACQRRTVDRPRRRVQPGVSTPGRERQIDVEQLGGSDPDHRTVLALATSARHPAIALAIAGANFQQQKAVLAVFINGVALAEFVAHGVLVWAPGLIMVAGGILGGYFGASFARQLPQASVRAFVIVVGWTMTVYFFFGR